MGIQGRQSVRAIVLNGDTLLAMKRNKFGMQYYTLIGGGIKIGEEQEPALRRELREETGMEVGAVRLVFMENDTTMYGKQFVYLCEYKGGDPALNPESEEAKISAMGQNTYEPLWLPLSSVPNVSFRSASVAQALLDSVRSGFPEMPQELAWKPETVAK
jgi:ADP-ribose pyrophosphatase YjhB (NUDIX family)